MANILFRHKRGATFIAAIIATIEAEPVDLTGWTVESEIRDAKTNRLMPDVVVTVTDAVAGEVTIKAQDTKKWPVGLLVWDVKLTDTDGNESISETVTFECVQEVTQ